VYPVLLRRGVGAVNADLEILLYRNRLQLATADALYSDGDRYLPALAIVKNLKTFLPAVKNVLVLGAGLGSMVRVIRQNGFSPDFTLVENDKVVLKWAMEFLPDTDRIAPVCIDARVFLEKNTAKYDLIFIDIFNSRVVPDFVTTILFLSWCRDSLSTSGRVSFNYMINDKHDWEDVQHVFGTVFPGYHTLDLGINKVLIS